MKKFVFVASFLALVWAGDAAAQNAQYASAVQSEFKVASAAYKDGYFGVAMRRWLELARSSNGPAQYNIGLMHFYGQGVKKDPVEAYKWFLLSERNGVEKGRQAMDKLARFLSPLQISDATRRARNFEKLSN